MSSGGKYRRHAPEFKIQLCQDIRSGAIGRRDAARKYTLSTHLIQLWLTQYTTGVNPARKRPRHRLSRNTKPRSQPSSARSASSPWSWNWLKKHRACAS